MQRYITVEICESKKEISHPLSSNFNIIRNNKLVSSITIELIIPVKANTLIFPIPRAYCDKMLIRVLNTTNRIV